MRYRYSHLAPFSTRPKKPGFSTKNQGFQVATIARSPVFGAGARSEVSDSEALASLRASAVATLGASALPPRAEGGYFTLIGAPGSGKSFILAKYVTENPSVVYYSAQIEGKNQADQFLATICTQLINHYPHVGAQHVMPLPDNATEGVGFCRFFFRK